MLYGETIRMTVFIILLLIAFSNVSFSNDYSWNLHLVSYHFDSKNDVAREALNTHTIGLGVQKSMGGNEYLVTGVYKNSFEDRSGYVAYGKAYGDSVNYGWVLGLANGYPNEFNNIGRLRAMGGLLLKYQHLSLLMNHKLVFLSLTL